MKMPKPVLKPNTLYLSDGGELICVRCAGASAKYTGRDLSGRRVGEITGSFALELATTLHKLSPKEHSGDTLSCEGGCTTITVNREAA